MICAASPTSAMRSATNTRGLGVGLGPYQRGAIGGGGIALQRQDREWPGGQEMFFGAAMMRALMRDRRDDRRLPVAPSMTGDAGLLAHARTRAIGRNQQR